MEGRRRPEFTKHTQCGMYTVRHALQKTAFVFSQGIILFIKYTHLSLPRGKKKGCCHLYDIALVFDANMIQ